MCTQRFRRLGLITLVGIIALGTTLNANGASAVQIRPAAKEADAPDSLVGSLLNSMFEGLRAGLERWGKATMLRAEHAHMAKAAGTWKGVLTAKMIPAKSETTGEITTVITTLMDGRYLRSESKGTIQRPEEEPFAYERLGHYGFNNGTGTYESTWMDNVFTMIVCMVGVRSEDGKVVTWTSEFVDPISLQKTWLRQVDTLIDDNTLKVEMFGPGPNGGDFKMMTINYTRVVDAGNEAAQGE